MKARLVPVVVAVILSGCAANGGRATPEPTPVPRPTLPPAESGAREMVFAFMDARVHDDADGAAAFLGPDAKLQYDEEEGLRLVGDIDDWELVSIEAADANSFEVIVRVHATDDSFFTETLFVGPGVTHNGEQREWIIRGVVLEGE